VEVDENNCILSNLKSILNTANKKFEGVLTSYMSNSKINFSKIIFAGHSQGSGHAAYVGSKYLCSKILLFSGPNDFLKKLNYQPAWFSKTTATPKEKIIAILHEKDEVVDFSIQKNNVEKLNNCFNTCNEMYFQQQKCNCIFLSKDNYKMVEKFHNISVRDEYEMKEIWNFILSD
jgi:predicted esterase